MGRSRHLIEKYFEGLASPDEMAELAECLKDPAVADLFAQFSRLEASLRSHFKEEGRIEETTSVLREIEQQIRREEQPRIRGGRVWIRWAAVAASVLLVISLGWWFWPRTGQPPEIVDHSPQMPKTQESPAGPAATKVVAGNIHINGREAKSAKNGERVHVVSEKSAILAMVDGSQAEMEPASQVVVHGEMAGMRQVFELVEGAGTFKVEPGEGQFQVETQVGRVIVLGTEFRVKLLPQRTDKDRVFPGTRITALAVLVTTGIVQVDIGNKSHILTAGQDRLFRPEREAGKGIRETLAIFDSLQPGTIIVRQGGDRPKQVTFPVAADARVTIDGKPATLAQLSKGMSVYLQRFLDDDEVLGLRVEGPTLIGVLKSLDEAKGTLTLTLPKGREASAKEKTLPCAVDVRILLGGEPIQLADLVPGMQIILKMSVDRLRIVEIGVVSNQEKERRP